MWDALHEALRHPSSTGCGAIQLLAEEPFYDEEELPFAVAGGGLVLHVLPDPGFTKESLAGSADERLLIVDCPDEEGWLAPDPLVAHWMARHVTCPALDDLLLTHPLYEYLTQTDEEGLSRGGRLPLVEWMPGLPHFAVVTPPEFLPDDDEAPDVNRDRAKYARAVVDLLETLQESFPLHEIECALRVDVHKHRK